MMPLRTFAALVLALCAALVSPRSDAQTSYQGLWYRGEVESGWGVNVAHQGNILFVTWFTYDADGTGMWLVGPNFTRTTGETFSGPLYRTTGARFDNYSTAPFAFTEVGTATLTFTDANNGTFSYAVNGVTQAKPIVRQLFSATQPTCTLGGSPSGSVNFSDLWWAGLAENGWGVNVAHQGDILFATWFTYDTNGRGMWIVGPRIEKLISGNVFTGPLYRVTGPAFSTVPWNPSGTATTQVGDATFTFSDTNSGTFTYSVNGVSQSKRINRQVFAAPATVCATPTQPPPDPLAPRVVYTVPLNGAADASTYAPITATLSAPMDPATVNPSTFTVSGPSGAVAGAVSFTGITATFTPSARLALGTRYSANITTGMRDPAGRPLARTHSFAFTTRADEPPFTAQSPTITAVWPQHLGSQVPVTNPVTATFSEPMDPATLNSSTFSLSGPTGVVPAAVSFSGVTATLTPSARLLTDAEYTATITTGARDPSGNGIPQNASFTFTTRPDEPPPVVSGCPVPASNAQLRRLEWGATPVLRMASGVVASFRVAQSQIGRASVAFTQGQTAATPPGVTIDLSVSRCPGVMEDNLHPSCRVRSTFTNFQNIVALNRPLTEQGLTTQDQHAHIGCLAPAANGQYYVNVRWTFPTCALGSDQCGFSLQWGEGPY